MKSTGGFLRPLAWLAAAAFICYGGTTIFELGFYSDDWALLQAMEFSGEGVPARLASSFQGANAFRPLMALHWLVPHALFGVKPVPWQFTMLLFNLLLSAAVFRLLAAYKLPRTTALLGAALFLAYPNKDATLFWPVTLVVTSSCLLFVVSYLLHLHYVETGRDSSRRLAAGTLLASLASYDQTFFLVLLWMITPRGPHGLPDGAGDSPPAGGRPRGRVDRRVWRGFLTGAAVVGLYAAYKWLAVPLLGGVAYNKSLGFSPRHFIYVFLAGLRCNLDPRFIWYVFASAFAALRSAPLWAAAAAVWLAVLLLGDDAKPEGEGPGGALMLLGAGFFVLGYLPIAFSDYSPSPINTGNRLNQAPALGVVIAALGWWRRAGCPRWARGLGIGAAGLFMLAHVTFAGFWARSYRVQLQVRDTILANIERWPAEDTLIIHMKERYVARKAPIFDAFYDITGAVRIWTGEAARRADVVNPRMNFRPDGIWYEGPAYRYDKVLLLDFDKGALAIGNYQAFRRLPPATYPWEKL